MRCYICDTTNGNIFVDPKERSREICQRCWDESHINIFEEAEFVLGDDKFYDDVDVNVDFTTNDQYSS